MKMSRVKAFVGFTLLIALGVGGGYWFSQQRHVEHGSYSDNDGPENFEGAGRGGDPGARAGVDSSVTLPPVPEGLEGCRDAEFHGTIGTQLLKWNQFITQDLTRVNAKDLTAALEHYRKENGLPMSVHENVVDPDQNAPNSLVTMSRCEPRPMTMFLKYFLNGEVNFRSVDSSVLPAADISELAGHAVVKHWPAEPDALPEFISGNTLYFHRMLIPECATCVDETCSEHRGPSYYVAVSTDGTFHVVDAPAAASDEFEGRDVDCPAAQTIKGINPQATILCKEYVDLASKNKRILIYDPPCAEDQERDDQRQ